MKKFIITAAIINLGVGIIHAIIGENEIVTPLLATDAVDTVRWTLHSAWHMISVVLFISGLTLLYVGLKGKDNTMYMILSKYIGVQYVALAMVFVVTSLIYGIFFPQIVMLAPIGILALLGSRAASKA